MNAEELFGRSTNPEHRERLYALVHGGKSKQYLGRELCVADLDSMSKDEMDKLYNTYQTRLGATMNKTIGTSFVRLYALGLSYFFDIEDEPSMIKELNDDPFIDIAMNDLCCDLYYRYGKWLAPLTATLTSSKYLRKKKGDIKENVGAKENDPGRNTTSDESPEESQTGGSGEEKRPP